MTARSPSRTVPRTRRTQPTGPSRPATARGRRPARPAARTAVRRRADRTAAPSAALRPAAAVRRRRRGRVAPVSTGRCAARACPTRRRGAAGCWSASSRPPAGRRPLQPARRRCSARRSPRAARATSSAPRAARPPHWLRRGDRAHRCAPSEPADGVAELCATLESARGCAPSRCAARSATAAGAAPACSSADRARTGRVAPHVWATARSAVRRPTVSACACSGWRCPCCRGCRGWGCCARLRGARSPSSAPAAAPSASVVHRRRVRAELGRAVDQRLRRLGAVEALGPDGGAPLATRRSCAPVRPRARPARP